MGNRTEERDRLEIYLKIILTKKIDILLKKKKTHYF